MASSGVICTIKLDPFYQAFLFKQFGFSELAPIFEFPKGHDLSLRFQFCLSRAPYKYKGEDHGEWSFKIEIPYMEHKDPKYYRYMSPTMQGIFHKRVRSFWKDVSHEIIGKEKRAGYEKEEIIEKLMEDFGFDERFRDRVRREYSRYLQAERNRRFRRKEKVLKNVN